MTRQEFDEIGTWPDLQDCMRAHDYYEQLDGDLFEFESDLMDAVEYAVRNYCNSIADLQSMDLNRLDPDADVWVASGDFSWVENYYNYDFDNVRNDFEEYLEANDLFDNEEDEVSSKDEDLLFNDHGNDEYEEPDIPLEMLLFGELLTV